MPTPTASATGAATPEASATPTPTADAAPAATCETVLAVEGDTKLPGAFTGPVEPGSGVSPAAVLAGGTLTYVSAPAYAAMLAPVS